MNPLDEFYDMLENQVLHLERVPYHSYTLKRVPHPQGDNDPWTRDDLIVVTEDGIPTEHDTIEHALIDIVTRAGFFSIKD